MYIYSKCVFCAKNGQVSYGYPMVMVWVSYGESRCFARKWRVRRLIGVDVDYFISQKLPKIKEEWLG